MDYQSITTILSAITLDETKDLISWQHSEQSHKKGIFMVDFLFVCSWHYYYVFILLSEKDPTRHCDRSEVASAIFYLQNQKTPPKKISETEPWHQLISFGWILPIIRISLVWSTPQLYCGLFISSLMTILGSFIFATLQLPEFLEAASIQQCVYFQHSLKTLMHL